MRGWCLTASMPAFQAGRGGSNPLPRSMENIIVFLSPLSFLLFDLIWEPLQQICLMQKGDDKLVNTKNYQIIDDLFTNRLWEV